MRAFFCVIFLVLSVGSASAEDKCDKFFTTSVMADINSLLVRTDRMFRQKMSEPLPSVESILAKRRSQLSQCVVTLNEDSCYLDNDWCSCPGNAFDPFCNSDGDGSGWKDVGEECNSDLECMADLVCERGSGCGDTPGAKCCRF